MRIIMTVVLVFCAFTCVSCKKATTEPNVNGAVEPQPQQVMEAEPVDNFNFAETIPATEADIVKALQGEWSSKENGFNYTLKILQ